MTGLVKRSFSLAGHRTSVALEAEFWAALTSIAQPRPLSALVVELDAARTAGQPLASTLRLHALRHRLPSTGGEAPALSRALGGIQARVHARRTITAL